MWPLLMSANGNHWTVNVAIFGIGVPQEYLTILLVICAERLTFTDLWHLAISGKE